MEPHPSCFAQIVCLPQFTTRAPKSYIWISTHLSIILLRKLLSLLWLQTLQSHITFVYFIYQCPPCALPNSTLCLRIFDLFCHFSFLAFLFVKRVTRVKKKKRKSALKSALFRCLNISSTYLVYITATITSLNGNIASLNWIENFQILTIEYFQKTDLLVTNTYICQTTWVESSCWCLNNFFYQLQFISKPQYSSNTKGWKFRKDFLRLPLN